MFILWSPFSSAKPSYDTRFKKSQLKPYSSHPWFPLQGIAWCLTFLISRAFCFQSSPLAPLSTLISQPEDTVAVPLPWCPKCSRPHGLAQLNSGAFFYPLCQKTSALPVLIIPSPSLPHHILVLNLQLHSEILSTLPSQFFIDNSSTC